jgi:hypothetical protein
MSLVSFSLIYFSLAAILTGYPLELEEINKSHTKEVNQATMSNDIIQLDGFNGPKIAQLFRSLHQGSVAKQPFQTKSEQNVLEATKDRHHPVSITEPTEEASELH